MPAHAEPTSADTASRQDHHEHGGATKDGATTDDAKCVMRGMCNAPASALASLIWVPGVLTASVFRAAVAASPLRAGAAVSTLDVFLDLTLPPPRV